MERIEREKHDIEREKIEAAEKQRKEERERQSGNVRKSAKRLKGMTNYFATWKRQNWH